MHYFKCASTVLKGYQTNTVLHKSLIVLHMNACFTFHVIVLTTIQQFRKAHESTSGCVLSPCLFVFCEKRLNEWEVMLMEATQKQLTCVPFSPGGWVRQGSGFVLLNGELLHGLFAQIKDILQQITRSEDVCRAWGQEKIHYLNLARFSKPQAGF